MPTYLSFRRYNSSRERAAAGGYDADLGDEEARIVANVCRQLDGVPLAIEVDSRPRK